MKPDPQKAPLGLLWTLYVSQAVPLGFFTVALPAILRQRGASLENVGLLSALALPWLIKFLWAPFVDRYGSSRHGHYRSWILPLQSLAVLTVLGIAVLDPSRNMGLLIGAGALFMLLAATQDIATDGLSVRVLSWQERGTGNGIQVGGFYLGQVLGGGVILIVFSRLGWTVAVLAMASFLLLPLIPALRFREPAPDRAEARRLDYRALGRFFTRRGDRGWIPILILFRAAETMAVTMVNPMLVDQGYSLEQIGILLGVAGSLAALSGAWLGGVLIGHVGRKASLVLFGFLQSAALGAFLLPASGIGGKPVIFLASMTVAFAGGMATAALYTNMMDRCTSRTAATDFSLQQSLAAVGPIVAASLSGFTANRLGYGAHFAICVTLHLVVVGMAARWLVRPVEPLGKSIRERLG